MKRPLRPRLVLVLVIVGGALAPAAPARARSLFDILLGDQPDSTVVIETAASEGFDSLGVARWADVGYISVEDVVRRLAGGNVARVGSDGVIHPIDLTGAGRGRLTLNLNGLPAGGGVIHWDNFAWIPIRGIVAAGVDRTPVSEPGAAAGGGGGHLELTTIEAGEEPLSTVSITGGSYGHRLAELDFSRKFGKYGFHADVADFSYQGHVFGVFGQTDRTRGFGELTFPLAGFRAALSAAISSGKAGSADFLTDDLEKTAEHRYALTLERGSERALTRFSILRHASHLESEGSASDLPFELDDGRWRAGFRHERRTGTSLWSLDLAAARETRSGVLPDDATFLSGGGALGFERPVAGAWRSRIRLGFTSQEPYGGVMEPGLRLWRDTAGTRLWVEGGRTAGVPGILVNQGSFRPDGSALLEIIDRLENLEKPESHWMLGGGAVLASGRAGLGLGGGASRIADSPGYLSASDVMVYERLLPDPEPFWTAHAEMRAFWAPRNDLELSLRGAYQAFSRGRLPFEPNLTGEGTITFRRDFFEHDLHLSAALGGELIGERQDIDGNVYPTALDGTLTLTGRIRALTLFWRIENMGDLYIESDLLDDAEFPVPLPGLHYRIGATLKLLD